MLVVPCLDSVFSCSRVVKTLVSYYHLFCFGFSLWGIFEVNCKSLRSVGALGCLYIIAIIVLVSVMWL